MWSVKRLRVKWSRAPSASGFAMSKHAVLEASWEAVSVKVTSARGELPMLGVSWLNLRQKTHALVGQAQPSTTVTREECYFLTLSYI